MRPFKKLKVKQRINNSIVLENAIQEDKEKVQDLSQFGKQKAVKKVNGKVEDNSKALKKKY